MPKSAVGLFKTEAIADDVVGEIESAGIPHNEVGEVEEPVDFEVTGVMSFPGIDFETQVFRGLTEMGATEQQAQAYVDGLRRGGVLVVATAPDQKTVDAAAKIMNRHGAIEVGETAGAQPGVVVESPDITAPMDVPSIQAGRMQQPEGARCFVW